MGSFISAMILIPERGAMVDCQNCSVPLVAESFQGRVKMGSSLVENRQIEVLRCLKSQNTNILYAFNKLVIRFKQYLLTHLPDKLDSGL